MAAPLARQAVDVILEGPVTSEPYVRMTLAMMEQFGIRASLAALDPQTPERGRVVTIAAGQRYTGRPYAIEPDASNASYFLAAAALVPGSTVVIPGLGRDSLQGDVLFADVLGQMGARLFLDADCVRITGTNRLTGLTIDMNSIPDMVQTLAVLALFADGPTHICNVGNLRIKETDRLAALETELAKLGARVQTTPDSITIEPPETVTPATIETYDDHRMAMAFAVAGLRVPGIRIANPACVAYDLPFGCPGWLQAVIQSDYFLRSGDAKRALVIGAETLSRVCDPCDRDSMIYADGAGAVVLEAQTHREPVGILAHAVRSDTLEHAGLLRMDRSFDREAEGAPLTLKMKGRTLYEYALATVPGVVQQSLERAGLTLAQVDKVLIHQANGKMDEAILKRLFKRFGVAEVPAGIMPMTVSWLGNSSVATVPTLLDLIVKGKLDGHSLASGDHVVFASVGAGMNINAMVYRWP